MVASTKRKAVEAFGDSTNPTTGPTTKRKRSHKNREKQPVSQNTKDELPTSIKATDVQSAPPPIGDACITTDDAIVPVALRRKRRIKKKDTRGTGEAPRGPPIDGEGTVPLEAANGLQSSAVSSGRRSRKEDQKREELVLGAEQQVVVARRKKTDKKYKAAPRTNKEWRLSAATAGLFLDQDPIVTAEHLILPTHSSVHVYSIRTSHLVRTISIEGKDNKISSCTLSSTSANHLLVSTSTGSITKWNWETGQEMGAWETDLHLIRIFARSASGEEESIFALYHATDKDERRISVCVFHENTKSVRHETCILRRRHIFPTLCALDGGNLLVLCSGRSLLLGQLMGPDGKPKSPQKPECLWREIRLPGEVASIDVRGRYEVDSSKGDRLALDLAVGLHDGAILIYDDILFKLTGKERGVKGAEVTSRKLHWHRGVVNTVKWSQDGNYLISGGNETVLVIWQLDTNQQQFLPHLASAICNIVVSHAGALYTLRLADNSVMALSTADLLPIANVGGLSLARNPASTTSVALNPTNPTHLLAAVPNNILVDSVSKIASNATMLQTFDLSTNHQIGKQALARNVTTALNITPYGGKVIEPNVSHLSITYDGRWLATVDEWTPPFKDLEALYPAGDIADEERNQSETCLRFWSWNGERQSWELVTRVDEPHLSLTSSVLGLAANPIRQEFATIGTDGYVRLWTPRRRHREGLPIKSKSGDSLSTWGCFLSLQPAPSPSKSGKASASLAYAEDGSILAASWDWQFQKSSRPVHFINALTGLLHSSQTDLLSNGEAKLSFLGQYLIALSQYLRVWDTVQARTVFGIALNSKLVNRGGSLLAVNPIDETFSVALVDAKRSRAAQVVVFCPRSPEPLYKKNLHEVIQALLPVPKAPGYVLVDAKAQIRQLQPPGAALHSVSLPLLEETLARGLDDVFGTRPLIDSTVAKSDSWEGATAGRTTKRLEDVFDEQRISLSALPVHDLFDLVANVFSAPQVVV